ncbi:MAG TPA: neutral zinc metallopeptidase [Longimicrobiales bacterium]|nr:neutral zinc metallopeptidase [Longimicrobiales bacterium]
MKWQGGRRSTNVRDLRGVGLVGGGIGAVVLTVVALLLGVNPGDLMQGTPPAAETGAAGDEASEFVSVVLADTEDTWNALFAEAGSDYPEPQLVLFTGMAQSACGMAQSAMGPFYCPRDQSVYIDLAFYRDLHERFGAPGDFAQAYVIAHEVGHHVQNVLGLLGDGMSRSTGPQSQAVRVELQADCFAGLWAHYAQRSRNVVPEAGDIDEALNAAAAIGDDRLQRQTQGQVVPETFSHGTSEQRARWFRVGYEQGSVQQCDTSRGTV